MLKIEHLGKTYGTGDKAVKAIADLDFEVTRRSWCAWSAPRAAARPRC